MEKPLEIDCVVPKVGWDRVSGNHQSGANSVSQVDVVSAMAPACGLCAFVLGGLRKETMASASTSVWEKSTPTQLSPSCWTIQFLPVCL